MTSSSSLPGDVLEPHWYQWPKFIVVGFITYFKEERAIQREINEKGIVQYTQDHYDD